MKAAEEWAIETGTCNGIHLTDETCISFSLKEIKQIQQDARDAALVEAANVASDLESLPQEQSSGEYKTRFAVKRQILALRTTKPTTDKKGEGK